MPLGFLAVVVILEVVLREVLLLGLLQILLILVPRVIEVWQNLADCQAIALPKPWLLRLAGVGVPCAAMAVVAAEQLLDRQASGVERELAVRPRTLNRHFFHGRDKLRFLGHGALFGTGLPAAQISELGCTLLLLKPRSEFVAIIHSLVFRAVHPAVDIQEILHGLRLEVLRKHVLRATVLLHGFLFSCNLFAFLQSEGRNHNYAERSGSYETSAPIL